MDKEFISINTLSGLLATCLAKVIINTRKADTNLDTFNIAVIILKLENILTAWQTVKTAQLRAVHLGEI